MDPVRVPLTVFGPAVAALLLLEGLVALPFLNAFEHPLVLLAALRVLEVAAFVAILRFSGAGLSAVGLPPAKIPRGLWRGALWSLGFGLTVGLCALILYLLGHNPLRLIRSRLPGDPLILSGYILLGGLLAPLAEEIFFRGIVYGFFRRWGILAALLISSLVFVLVHPAAGPTQAIGGVLFAVSYEIERNLAVPITIHALGNLAIFAVSLLS